ncbi:MAG: hypothetical protein D6730_18170 [Bacteroidetes bacterium]|nr:MAG: hypothetical protein D6730_18170 [Bacteroidota bacterium]
MEIFVNTCLSILAVYMLIGFVFGLVFVLRGVQQIDAAAKGSSWGFRLLILPGSVAFWPLLLHRWRKAMRASAE